MTRPVDRRRFLQAGAAIFAAPGWVPAMALGHGGRPAPSERITIGLIGAGGRGMGVLRSFLKEKDAQVIAVCDPYEQHHRDKNKGKAFGRTPAVEAVGKTYKNSKSCDAYADYRELCARDDIDAVIVASPDHWHALHAIEALRHGKDVYCEKPLTHFFAEGQALSREVAKQKAVFQTGSQQRSDRRFRKAVELVLNGVIGKVTAVEIGLPKGHDKALGDTAQKDYSGHGDYDMWTGPAPLLPYMPARHHRNWRWHSAYGGGQLMDWIGHHNDIAHWGLGEDGGGPIRVEARNWRSTKAESYDTPVEYELHCEYAGGVRSSIGTQHPMGTKWIGEDGWVHVTRGKLTASNDVWAKPNFNPGAIKARISPGHVRDFLEGVRTRAACICPAETAHRSITPGHLGYVSNALGRALNWDHVKERVKTDPEADKLLRRMHHRAPWALD